MAEVYDRWHKRDSETGHRVRSADYGCKSRWQVRWRDGTGIQKKQNFIRRVQADARCAEIEDTLNKGTYVDPVAGKKKLRDYVKIWLGTLTIDPASKERVEARVRLHVLPELGDKELRTLVQQPSLVQTWLAGLTGRLAPNHVRVVYAHFTAVMTAAVNDGLIVRSPAQASSVKPPPPERRRVIPWTTTRVRIVIGALDGRYRIAAIMAAGLGLRQGECFGLGVDDVDFLRKVAHVRRQVKIVANQLVFAPPKRGKERDVPLSDQIALLLAAHLRAYPAVQVTLPWRQPGGKLISARLIMTSETGGTFERRRFNEKTWGPALRAAGVPRQRDNGMHALRHYFASILLERGVSIKAVAAYLGHADEAFTLRTYTHLMPSSEQGMRVAVDAAFTATGPGETGSALDVPTDASGSA